MTTLISHSRSKQYRRAMSDGRSAKWNNRPDTDNPHPINCDQSPTYRGATNAMCHAGWFAGWMYAHDERKRR